MEFFPAVFVFISVAVCDAELNLEAADGEDVTISFNSDELNRADQVKITFTRQSQKNLIAQYCRCAHCGDCSVVETPGVLLRVEEGTLTLQDVRSRNSGVYEAKIIAGNIVYKMKVTLVVNKPPQTSIISNPPQTSIISNPPNSPESHRLHVVLVPALVVFILGVLGVYLLYKWKRERVEEARETTAVSRPNVSRKIIGKSCYDCAISLNRCRENTDLLDT